LNEISALIKEILQSFFAPSAVKTQKEGAICEPGSGSLPDIVSASTLILDFSDSWIARNKFLLFISHPMYDTLLQWYKLREHWEYYSLMVVITCHCFCQIFNEFDVLWLGLSQIKTKQSKRLIVNPYWYSWIWHASQRPPKSSSSAWCYCKVVESLRDVTYSEVLDHWGHILEGDCAMPVSSSFFWIPAIGWVDFSSTFLSPLCCIASPVAQKQQSHLAMSWNLQTVN
jgi:hypothetical protein